MKALRKVLRRPAVGAALVCFLTLGVLLGLRAIGWLQRPELMVYDLFLRQRALGAAVTDPRIVICGMTEEDLIKYGHPLDDAKLADLLEKIAAAGPCVIGLDFYRDLKEPRSGELYPQLEKTLLHLDKVIAIERVPGIKPPPILEDKPDRFAANNLPSDYQIDGIVRRAYLFLEGGLAEPHETLALRLTQNFLAAHQVNVDMVDSPGSPAPLLRLGHTTFPRLTPNAGAYSGLAVQDYEILLDFRSPRKYLTFSFDEVLENRLPMGAIKDAIVIVGNVTDSVKDYVPTLMGEQLRGPIAHAIIVNQLLRSAIDDERPTRWWPESAKIAWIGLCTLLGGAFGFVLRSPWRLAPALALLLGAIFLTCQQALRHALWIPMTTPAMGAFAAATFVTSLVLFLERSDRRVMHALFSRHVSKEVLEVLWAAREQFLDGGRLKPQRVIATVLFTDLKDYSTLSEEMDPADLLNWSNEYMNHIAPKVELHGGVVNSYRGDAIMAVFGAPVPHTREQDLDRDAIRAVECALAMRREMELLNSEWTERGLPGFSMRVGIFTGPVVIGSMGSNQRLEYAVLGDTTNTAARLESMGKELNDDEATPPCTILIGDATWQRLHGCFTTKLVGSKRLKGKAKEVIVHSVISEAQETSPL